MKIFELEPGKVYTYDELYYKVNDKRYLYYKSKIDKNWETSLIGYNLLLFANFTEYIEPIDWSNVEIDTLIEVSDDGEVWERRNFATFFNRIIYCFPIKGTSNNSKRLVDWNYARLIKED